MMNNNFSLLAKKNKKIIKQLQQEILVLDKKKRELPKNKDISHKTYKIRISLYIENWNMAKKQIGHNFYMSLKS